MYRTGNSSVIHMLIKVDHIGTSFIYHISSLYILALAIHMTALVHIIMARYQNNNADKITGLINICYKGRSKKSIWLEGCLTPLR